MNEPATHRRLRAVLGLGGTVDYEVDWDPAVMVDVAEGYRVRDDELDSPGPIDSERDLVVSVLALMRAGGGGERYVASSAIIEQFAERFDTRVTLGGTCVRAAIAMSAVGVPSTVHLVSTNDVTRDLLPEDVSFVCSATEDTTDPHLIVQYPKGAHLVAGDIDFATQHPNRLIYANDPPHRDLALADELGDVLATAGLFLVSSLNAIQDRELLDARLAALGEHLTRLPDNAVVMFEDAGYHVPAFATVVRDAMAHVADVYSLNEDELQAHLGRDVDLLDVDQVVGAVTDFADLVDVPVLVVHTRHWALAFGDQARQYHHALASGTTMAATRYRCGDGFSVSEFRRTATWPTQDDGAELRDKVTRRLGQSVACVPGHHLDVAAPSTIGLGDTFVGGFVAGLVAPSSTRPD